MAKIKVKIRQKSTRAKHPIRWVDQQMDRMVKSWHNRSLNAVAVAVEWVKVEYEGDLERALHNNGIPDLDDLQRLDRTIQRAIMNPMEQDVADFVRGAVGFAAGVAKLDRPPEEISKQIADQARENDPVDRAAIDYAQANLLNVLMGRDATTSSIIRDVLLKGLQDRIAPDDMARKALLQLDSDATFDSLNRVFRTESSTILNRAIMQNGLEGGNDFVYVHGNPGYCKHCDHLIVGRVFPVRALLTASNIGRKQSDWIPALPLHPNCYCVPTPASRYLIDAALEAAGGTIPDTGVRVEYVRPANR